MTPDTPLAPLTRLQQWAIALGLVSMGVGFTVSFVVAAPLARDAGLTEIEVAGILTFSALVFALLTPFWGRLATRFGRKRIMMVSLGFMGLTNAAFILALNAALAGLVTGIAAFLLLAVTRLSFGLLSPGLQPSAYAAMTDATTAETRAAGMGLLGAAMNIGSILGPALAAGLAPVGALAPLWASVAVSWAAALVIGIVLPRSPGQGRGFQRPPPLRLMDPRVRPFLLFLFCYFVALGGIQQTLAWLVKDRYLLERADAVQWAGLAFASMAVALVVVQFGYVARVKPPPRRMLIPGLVSVSAGLVGVALAGPFWIMCACFALVGVGGALIIPAVNAMGSLSVARQEQGSAAALLAAAPPAGFVVGPLLGAAAYMVAPVLPLVIAAAIITGLFLYALTLVGRDHAAPAA